MKKILFKIKKEEGYIGIETIIIASIIIAIGIASYSVMFPGIIAEKVVSAKEKLEGYIIK
jgi:hypothetical protein